jgi:hypothetical protein
MTVPQPFQYQGSKRALAALILQYLPSSTTRLAERERMLPSHWKSVFTRVHPWSLAGFCASH